MRDHRGGRGQHGGGGPAARFNAGLRALTAANGALLISDEVMTGFRVSSAGWYGLDPVPADLFTFGKVMSGGLPAAAFGGRASIMAHLAPAARSSSGDAQRQPGGRRGGLATLRIARRRVRAAQWRGGDDRTTRLGRLGREGVVHQVQYAGNCSRCSSDHRS